MNRPRRNPRRPHTRPYTRRPLDLQLTRLWAACDDTRPKG